MSARDKLIAVLAIFESNRAAMAPVADEILNAHAHELAELIRSESGVGSSWEDAADLIDPEVQ